MNSQTLLEFFGRRPGRLESLENLAFSCGVDAASTVLEAGCGTGDGIAHLCMTFGCNGVGLDLDKEALALAIGKYGHIPRLRFKEGSVYSIDSSHDEFDFIVTEAAFSLLADKQRAAKEYYRVLKAGGRLFFRDFVSMDPVDSKGREDIGYIPCFKGIGTIESYADIFEMTGFRILRREVSIKELIATALYLSKAYGTKPTEISHLFARIMNAGVDAGNRGQCFFSGNKLGVGFLIAEK